MKLDIGAGDRPYDDGSGEWVHLDERNLPHIEIHGDAGTLGQTWGIDESFDELLARHILEHFSYRDTVEILKGWFNVLKPGGKLRIEVPSFTWQALEFTGASQNYTDEEIIYYIFGEQDYPGNFHKAAFTEDLLRRRLEEAGFIHIDTNNIGQVIIAEAWKP